ncbi:MAG: hypothetical protein P0Y55_15865 [Candidatus Cohnella colombiensis]|uniref:Uncharacterized protein n=1 Tax=Candidatus Cohnella colombiensis TaxID=3121368 RepID=A0AA95EW82_9BACL|nr:MAG: hypothetical protein P0Y55_15865 [Cohnella sp.]
MDRKVKVLNGSNVLIKLLEHEGEIVELKIEYNDGHKSKLDLIPIGLTERNEKLESFINEIDWNKVEEVEIEVEGGRKIEIKVEVKSKRGRKRRNTEEETDKKVEDAEVSSLSDEGLKQRDIDRAGTDEQAEEKGTSQVAHDPSAQDEVSEKKRKRTIRTRASSQKRRVTRKANGNSVARRRHKGK